MQVKRKVSVVVVTAIACCPSGPGYMQVHAGNPTPRSSESRCISGVLDLQCHERAPSSGVRDRPHVSETSASRLPGRVPYPGALAKDIRAAVRESAAEERLTRHPTRGRIHAPANALQAYAGSFPTWASPLQGRSSQGTRSPVGVLAMNSADRARWLQPSSAMPVDGGARPDPDPKDSAPDTDDALADVLRAMQDAVEKRREPTSEKGDLFHRREA
jgi:hypothetical protein